MVDAHLDTSKKHSLNVERGCNLFPFFISYLASPLQILGHFRGDSLTKPMLITVLDTYLTRRSLTASQRGWVSKSCRAPNGA